MLCSKKGFSSVECYGMTAMTGAWFIPSLIERASETGNRASESGGPSWLMRIFYKKR